MNKRAALFAILFYLVGGGGVFAAEKLYLDGKLTPVRWLDGDTFRVLAGKLKGAKARLFGFNTLESYGPVHRWGRWTPSELLEIAHRATVLARSGVWHCQQVGQRDKYGRILVRCSDLALRLVESGLAHVFSVGTRGDEALLKAQRRAIAKAAGMWAKGVPDFIVTSVHSSEKGRLTYHRLISVRTGGSHLLHHRKSYKPCQWICPRDGICREKSCSCMLYLPYKLRYKSKGWFCSRFESEKRSKNTHSFGGISPTPTSAPTSVQNHRLPASTPSSIRNRRKELTPSE